MNRILSPPGRWLRPNTVAPGVLAFGLAVFLLCFPCWAQIEGPTESEPYKLIRHTLATPIPEGAYLADGGWEIIGASATVTADVEVFGNKVVWTGTPGVYTIIFDGILLRDVTFTDGAGNEITIKSYIGRVKARATTTIKGGVTPPDPPPPPPPRERVAVIIEESSERTYKQAILHQQLRAVYPPGKLSILDDDVSTAQKYVKLLTVGTRPALIVLDTTGQVIRQGVCPSTVAAVKQEIER